jgi:hypothetical protein
MMLGFGSDVNDLHQSIKSNGDGENIYQNQNSHSRVIKHRTETSRNETRIVIPESLDTGRKQAETKQHTKLKGNKEYHSVYYACSLFMVIIIWIFHTYFNK